MNGLLAYLRPYFGRMSVQLVIKAVGTVMELFLPWILAHIIDDIVPLRELGAICFWGLMMLACAAIGLVGNIVANRMASMVSRKVTTHLRHDLMAKIASLSSRQVDRIGVPSLEARLTSDSYNVHQMITMLQRMGVRAPILLIGGIAVTLKLEPVLTLTLLASLPLILAVVIYISKKGVPLYKKTQRAVDDMVLLIRESVSGIRVIKALSKTEYEKKHFDGVNMQLVKKETKAATTMAISNPLIDLLLNIGLTVVIVVGAFRVNSGDTQPGAIIAFLSYFTIILNALLAVTRMFVIYSKGSASAQRINEVLTTKEDLVVEKADSDKPSDGLAASAYHIAFDNVGFSYNRRQENITGISFALQRGEVLGIIGPTGSGKTTIINLLMRFYDVDCGRVLIDGAPVNTIPLERLRRMFGVVFQNDTAFSDTLRENIDFGRGLSDDTVKAASAGAQLLEYVEGLEAGYDHHITTGGTNLSGGQRQRLFIARAIAAHPDILILDDASSALDYKTDAKLRRAIAEQYSGITTIIVTQRVSSIRHANHILVLDDGQAVGYGTHEELMQSCHDYSDIAVSQMGGEVYAAN